MSYNCIRNRISIGDRVSSRDDREKPQVLSTCFQSTGPPDDELLRHNQSGLPATTSDLLFLMYTVGMPKLRSKLNETLLRTAIYIPRLQICGRCIKKVLESQIYSKWLLCAIRIDRRLSLKTKVSLTVVACRPLESIIRTVACTRTITSKHWYLMVS